MKIANKKYKFISWTTFFKKSLSLKYILSMMEQKVEYMKQLNQL